MSSRRDPAPLLPGLERLTGRLLEGVRAPSVGLVRQVIEPPVVDDLEGSVCREFRRPSRSVEPRRIAVAAVGDRPPMPPAG